MNCLIVDDESLAREVIERRAGMDSAACGALLRKAWSTAQQQE